MRRPVLTLLLLMVCTLVLTGLVLRQKALRSRAGAQSALAVLFGDGRRLFANHFLSKADAYFHRGRYPSIFEMAEREKGNHLVESVGDESGGDSPGHVHGPDCDHEAEGQDGDEGEHGEEHDESCAHAEPASGPDDWISRLAARFQPDQHLHLEAGGQKEMLPWVKLAVEMDPHNVDAYTVGGYWLRQMGKSKEAEAFLREGQRNNPDSSEIYFELGRLIDLEGKNPAHAVRLYLISLEKWRQTNQGLQEPDTLAVAQILGRLGKAEQNRGELEAALHYYTLLKDVSQNPDGVQQLIDEVKAQLPDEAGSTGQN